MWNQTVSVINMSRKRKVDDVDWSALANAREHKRLLVLEIYHCPIEYCSHPGFTGKTGCRKHINNIHPWYFDQTPTKDINDQMTSTPSNQDLKKKTSSIYMPSYPVNQGVVLEFSSWLTAICGGGISKSLSQQTASRAMKFSQVLFRRRRR